MALRRAWAEGVVGVRNARVGTGIMVLDEMTGEREWSYVAPG